MGSISGIEFYKMSGHGNDFIIIDNRDNNVPEEYMVQITKALCRRRLSIGADGMIFIQNGSPGVDFTWRFFNEDGSEAEMCGNGARCAARYAQIKGIAKNNMRFLTLAGEITAEVSGQSVKVGMTKPHDPDLDFSILVEGSSVLLSSLNTGVPHAVIYMEDVEEAQVVETGRLIRFHRHFQPDGANVNFAQVVDRGYIINRTYERGVEDETLACGTGCIAAVLLAELKGLVDSPVRVLTRGGEELLVHYSINNGQFTELYLEGPVRVVASGLVGPDALKQ